MAGLAFAWMDARRGQEAPTSTYIPCSLATTKAERGASSFLPTRNFPASFRFHEHKHFCVIQKATLRHTHPMRTHNDFIIEDHNRADRKLVYFKA
jgi:hypothetical protein